MVLLTPCDKDQGTCCGPEEAQGAVDPCFHPEGQCGHCGGL